MKKIVVNLRNGKITEQGQRYRQIDKKHEVQGLPPILRAYCSPQSSLTDAVIIILASKLSYGHPSFSRAALLYALRGLYETWRWRFFFIRRGESVQRMRSSRDSHWEVEKGPRRPRPASKRRYSRQKRIEV